MTISKQQLAAMRDYLAEHADDQRRTRYEVRVFGFATALLDEVQRLNDEALTMTRQFDGVTQERDRALALVQAMLPVVQTVASIKEWAGDPTAPYDARISLLTILQARKALKQHEGGATK